jgi:uncharacterized protein (TIGR02678 family)
MSERLRDALSHHRDEEQERALRALLMRPLMTEADPSFPFVRQHAEYLRNWLSREAGWVLRVDPDCARLYKRPADRKDTTRGNFDFDRRRYALLCLVCAVLERSEPQITLARLGERLLESAADPALSELGFTFSLEHRHERQELVDVCKYLLSIHVLGRVNGDENAYLQRSGDALYDIHRRALGGLLATTRGPSMLPREGGPATLDEHLAAITTEYEPETEDGRRLAVRFRLARRLLDDPVVYLDELTPEELEYFRNQRGAMGDRLRIATGLVPEHRAEGMALIEKADELTDIAMPAEGTEAHTTLLTAEFLADEFRKDPDCRISMVQIAAHIRAKADEYGKYWRKEARAPGAEREYAERAVKRLFALKLVALEGAVVAPRPALARFTVAPALLTPASQSEDIES